MTYHVGMSPVTVLQLNPTFRAPTVRGACCRRIRTGRLRRAVAAAGIAMICGLYSGMAWTEEAPRGPDVLIIAGADKMIYEFRQNGVLRMVRIVPKWGKPYYLVPRDNTQGFGDLQRAETLLPQWVIAEF